MRKQALDFVVRPQKWTVSHMDSLTDCANERYISLTIAWIKDVLEEKFDKNESSRNATTVHLRRCWCVRPEWRLPTSATRTSFASLIFHILAWIHRCEVNVTSVFIKKSHNEPTPMLSHGRALGPICCGSRRLTGNAKHVQ
jgi:hypothetical protein